MRYLYHMMRISGFLLLTFVLLLTSCEPDEVFTPRPRGYFRIGLPEKNYVPYSDSSAPYTMEIPDYARMYRSSAPNAPATWKDLYFGKFKATLYLTYNEITSDSIFAKLINESWELSEAHNEMSQAFRDSIILRPEDRVYGTVIELGGSAASLVQFYLTDSVKNFIRGSLYFYAAPNKDSLKPVVDYIKQDVFHLVETLKWTKPADAPASSPANTTPKATTEDWKKILDNTRKSDQVNPGTDGQP